ncbi:hypothetical protein XENORESO_007179 [Xenotaenia resolanae]|uniref:Uncharacterized protein n=1 Tax=Xenotaenia resolanae TaxID=208358 RepID=A0ABV0VSG3_9TELE
MSRGDNVTALSAYTAVWGKSVYKASLEFGQTKCVKMSRSSRKGLNPKVQACLSVLLDCKMHIQNKKHKHPGLDKQKDTLGPTRGQLTNSVLHSLLGIPCGHTCREGSQNPFNYPINLLLS